MSERFQDSIDEGDIRIGLVRSTSSDKARGVPPFNLTEIAEKTGIDVNELTDANVVKPKAITPNKS